MIPTLTPRLRAVFSAIYSAPGLHVSAVARRAGVRQCEADRAVLRLEKFGLVRTTTAPGATPPARRHCLPADWTVHP